MAAREMATHRHAASPGTMPGALCAGPTPKHAQLREILRELVSLGLPPGAWVPSERNLAATYSVSRLTVRAAVNQLVTEGLLTRVPGKGTFSTRARLDAPRRLTSFTQDTTSRGAHPETVVLGADVAVPPPPTAHVFGLASSARAYRLARLRKAGGIPMAVERGWYHPDLVPGLLDHDLTTSLYALLARAYDVAPEQGTQTVLAGAADAETATLLGISTSSPVLVFRRVCSAHGRTVEDMTSWYRGDLYQVTTQLGRIQYESGPERFPGGTR